LCAQSVVEWPVVLPERHDPCGLPRHLLRDPPGFVGASIVEDVDVIAPAHAAAEKESHDIGFILNDADSVDLHVVPIAGIKRGNTTGASFGNVSLIQTIRVRFNVSTTW